MTRKVSSYRLSDHTLAQIAVLSKSMGSAANVITLAVDRLYQENNMSDITIGKIDTIPQFDPYRRTGQPSATVVELDPQRRLVTVDQEYDSGSTSMERWHGHVITWRVDGHPQEEDMRQWLEDHMPQFAVICDSHSVEWNGNNHVGRMTDEASEAEAAIDRELAQGWPPFDPEQGWSLWDARDWLQDMPAEWSPVGRSDEQLEALAAEIEDNARGDRIILYDTLTVLTEIRDETQDDD